MEIDDLLRMATRCGMTCERLGAIRAGTKSLETFSIAIADAVREQDAQKSGWNGCHFTAAEIRAMKGKLP
jgi:hypothetical protein